MAEDSESAASQQSLELDDQDTCGIDGDNEEEAEHARGSPGRDLGAKKKKKKQKRKKEKPHSGGAKSDSASDSQEIKIQQPSKNPTIPMQKLQDIQRAMELLSACQGPARSLEDAAGHRYQFWDTQPVPKLNEVVTSHGAIEPDKDNVRQEPYSLPQGFMWDTLDLSISEVLKELYTLLNENYVEDDDNMFRFDYSPEFLLWALRPPGWLPQWHCGVRVSSNKKLVGFISAIPASIRVYDSVKKMVEINFLCVHKKLRSKRVAPVLIREITRRVNLEGLFQAVYTAGVVLPKPVATCRYWHRSLNPRKLVEVKFSHLSRNMTLQRTMKLYRLPDVKTKAQEGLHAVKGLSIVVEDVGHRPRVPCPLWNPFASAITSNGVTAARPTQRQAAGTVVEGPNYCQFHVPGSLSPLQVVGMERKMKNKSIEKQKRRKYRYRRIGMCHTSPLGAAS
ncbi:glycylpeptide N-tetradecanoyltransferase 2 isoform X3 [Tamandua tetradactyla]|uniref:glycylpeptide N-tetradecanoyltransferase 2 isoform X3 n=1 Tax=Tamandua tetradactyla TaxID=48850 RepID=UPI004053E9E4